MTFDIQPIQIRSQQGHTYPEYRVVLGRPMFISNETTYRKCPLTEVVSLQAHSTALLVGSQRRENTPLENRKTAHDNARH